MNYFKSIFVFGFLIPSIIFALVFGGVYYGYSALKNTAENRKAVYEKLAADEANIASLEQKVLPYRGAIAYFENQKKIRTDEKLPVFVDNVCDSKLNGQIMKTGLSFTQGRPGEGSSSTMEFTTRYEALEKLLTDIELNFPYLKVVSGDFSPAGPTASMPTPHLEVKVIAATDKSTEKTEPVVQPIK